MIIVVTGTRRHRRGSSLRVAFATLGLGPDDTIYHGDARGVDAGAARFGGILGCTVVAVPVDASDGPWPAAGARRNERMLRLAHPDLVLAFPCPESRGTWHCVSAAKKRGIEVRVIPWLGDSPEGGLTSCPEGIDVEGQSP